LSQERLISKEQYDEWQQASPREMAKLFGLNPAGFIPGEAAPQLDRYPVAILEKTKKAIQDDLLSPAQAANLLDLDVKLIQTALLSNPPRAEKDELLEYAELPF
jgi:hypothetical protein